MEDPIPALKGAGPLGKTSLLKKLHNNLRDLVVANKVKNLRKGERYPDYDLHLLGRSHKIDSYEDRHE
jgi:hypothetical protein